MSEVAARSSAMGPDAILRKGYKQGTYRSNFGALGGLSFGP